MKNHKKDDFFLMRTWDSDTMTKGGDWFHLFIRFAGLRNTPWIRDQKDCHLLINARQAFLRMPRKSRCVFFSVTHGFHVRRGWLYLKFKESGYPLKNVLNILMSVPWPIALGSVRKRIFQLFGLAVSGASRSRTSMNGPNQEEAISAPEQRRVHIFLRLQDRKTFYGIG